MRETDFDNMSENELRAKIAALQAELRRLNAGEFDEGSSERQRLVAIENEIGTAEAAFAARFLKHGIN